VKFLVLLNELLDSSWQIPEDDFLTNVIVSAFALDDNFTEALGWSLKQKEMPNVMVISELTAA
jgi:hypothetical protein